MSAPLFRALLFRALLFRALLFRALLFRAPLFGRVAVMHIAGPNTLFANAAGHEGAGTVGGFRCADCAGHDEAGHRFGVRLREIVPCRRWWRRR